MAKRATKKTAKRTAEVGVELVPISTRRPTISGPVHSWAIANVGWEPRAGKTATALESIGHSVICPDGFTVVSVPKVALPNDWLPIPAEVLSAFREGRGDKETDGAPLSRQGINSLYQQAYHPFREAGREVRILALTVKVPVMVRKGRGKPQPMELPTVLHVVRLHTAGETRPGRPRGK